MNTHVRASAYRRVPAAPCRSRLGRTLRVAFLASLIVATVTLAGLSTVAMIRGPLQITAPRWRVTVDEAGFYFARVYAYHAGQSEWAWDACGVSISRGGRGDLWGIGMDTVQVDTALPFALGWATTAFALWRASRRAQRQPAGGHCATCHYDLRGNVSGVCPECGERFGQRC